VGDFGFRPFLLGVISSVSEVVSVRLLFCVVLFLFQLVDCVFRAGGVLCGDFLENKGFNKRIESKNA
jgi:hypothetical protein